MSEPDTAPPTTADVLLALADDTRPGLLFEDQTYTWAEVVQHGARRAAVALDLREEGRPFHIGVLLDNEPDYLFWIVGAALAGAAIVGINPTRRGAELAHDIQHTDCQLVVTSEDHRAVLDDIDLGLAGSRVLSVGSPSYTALLERHAEVAAADVSPPIDPAAPLLLLFTSGSTGAPKAVVCSQARFAGIALQVPGRFGITDQDVCYSAMPMFHGNALMASWAVALGAGAPWAIRRRFSASGFLSDVRRFGATYCNYVGRSLAYILATAEQPDDADNPLRLAFGTEATDRDMAEFGRRFGCGFIESYGSSEGQIAMTKTADTPATALGVAQEGDVAVVDPETGAECPRARLGEHDELLNGEAIGELVRRDAGKQFEGYYNNPEATAERGRGGWYWSGDLAYRDEDGWFYFAGRGGDMLRVDSENFSAAPVERIISRFPAVVVAAVYPVPDPVTGDQVMATIELVPGTAFDPAAFDTFLAGQPDLGTKWAPSLIRIVDHMPLTGTNKVDKTPLRSQRWDPPGRVWWRPERGAPLQLMGADDRAGLEAAFDRHGRRHLLL